LSISQKQIGAGMAAEMEIPQTADPHSLDGAAIKLTSSGASGSIVANYLSYDRHNQITRSMPFKDIGDYGISTGGYPWRLDGSYHSKVFITNVGKVRAAIGGSIRPKDGPQYLIDTRYLEVGETAVFDIRRIRDEQIPDPKGVKLPRDADVGQFDWTTIFGDGSQRFIGRNEVIDRSSGVSASFSCGGVCNCPYSTLYAFITPGSPIVPVNGSLGVVATANTTDSCGGSGQYNYTIYPSPWNINSPGYFNLTSGQPTSNMTGTNGGDSYFYTPFTGTQYVWNGQSGNCMVNGNPVLNPGGNGLSYTPVQHNYPGKPLSAPCWISQFFDHVYSGKVHRAQDVDNANSNNNGGSATADGTPVYAAEAGTVVKADGTNGPAAYPACVGSVPASPANYVKIQGSDGYFTVYVHVTPTVAVGTPVTQGQQIGVTDNSGCQSGGHIHMRRTDPNGTPVNFTVPCVNPLPTTNFSDGVVNDDDPDIF
jgi:murein DD-endopeptidase MepM/ murein hydrolase activator NlpD